MQLPRKGYPWHFGLHFMTYYLATSVYQNFIAVYFKAQQLTTMQLSVLMAAMPMISILSQPMWGSIGDRMKSKRTLYMLLALGSMALILCYRFTFNFYFLLLMVTLFSSLFTAIQPLGDSIVLEALMQGRKPFGPLRLMGCLVFAVSSLIVGKFLTGRDNWIIYLTSIFLGFVALSSFALPNIAGHQREKGDNSGFFSLLKDKTLRDLLIFVTLLQIAMGYFYAFFSVHFVQIPGGTSELLGRCYLISALCEVPFLLAADKLFDKFGAGKMVCVTALVLTVRFFMLGMTENLTLVMLSQALHGGGFIVMTVCVSKYISLTVPEALRSRGQMLLSVVGFGIARVFGTLGGGILADHIGMQHGFLFTAALSLAALVYFAPKYIGKPALNGR